jgi:hypothetical protein
LCSEFKKFPRSRRENFCASRGYKGIVFDSNPANPFHVNARFHSHDVSRIEKPFLVARDSRVFMDFQADPVPRAVNKVTA